MRRFVFILVLLGSAALAHAERITGWGGLDTGCNAVELVKRVEATPEWYGAATHPWLRIRGLQDPTNRENDPRVLEEIAALGRLRVLGFRTICILRWDDSKAKSGVRPGGGQRVPLDLRDAFTRAKAYGRAYGAVTTFEVDNEPDISFVEENPETYAAFLKTCYLGFKAGAEEASVAAQQRSTIRRPSRWRRVIARVQGWFRGAPPANEPLVVMAPLALPPGPYLAQLAANDAFSATDAFNYHYYGYAEDFTDTYRQFENAVNSLGASAMSPAPRRRALPVLLTEYGYGSLSEVTRHTTEGRVRQWRWFHSVGEQARALRIEGPMAFYLRPYLEQGTLEFGLTTPASATGVSAPVTAEAFRAGDLTYTPADFTQPQPVRLAESASGGAVIPTPVAAESAKAGAGEGALKANATPERQSWMRDIGRKVGGDEATPALAWLLEDSREHPYAARAWSVPATPASPIVVDFVAKSGLAQVKRYTGYIAFSAANPAVREGAGEIVLYNFSTAAVQGHLRFEHTDALHIEGLPASGKVTIVPGERLVIPLRLAVEAKRFARVDWRVRFEPDDRVTPAARFTTALYPEGSKMKETVITRFAESGSASKANRVLLAGRPLAAEETGFQEHGRWRVTPGVSVTETPGGGWRFSIAAFPDGRPRPSAAELPLSDDFIFPETGMMRFMYRLAEPAGATIANGRYCEAYFRTANGNLYQVWPRQYAIEAWTEYTEVKENYTMAFYGRAKLPWRFTENRPVALVLTFRPMTAPAVYEVKDARIVTLEEAVNMEIGGKR